MVLWVSNLSRALLGSPSAFHDIIWDYSLVFRWWLVWAKGPKKSSPTVWCLSREGWKAELSWEFRWSSLSLHLVSLCDLYTWSFQHGKQPSQWVRTTKYKGTKDLGRNLKTHYDSLEVSEHHFHHILLVKAKNWVRPAQSQGEGVGFHLLMWGAAWMWKEEFMVALFGDCLPQAIPEPFNSHPFLMQNILTLYVSFLMLCSKLPQM